MQGPFRLVASAGALLALGALVGPMFLHVGCQRAPGRALSAGFSVAAEATDPIEFGVVPDFALTDPAGQVRTGASLRGTPYVLAALFTRCTGPCPAIAANLARLQRELADSGALLVTVTVDPGFDTPEVLAEYAEGWGADPDRWIFLTGSPDEVDALVRRGFLLAVDRAGLGERPPGQAVTHDTRLVAVDAAGKLRGYYDGRTDAGRDALLARMRFLAR